MAANQRESHRTGRIGWLRAAVLGANDGIVSTASLVVGVAAASAVRGDVLIAGVAGLVGAMVIGKRVGFMKDSMTPHSLTMTMIGASLLWVGWFGFNAGSALEAGNFAALAFINTLLATAGAVVAWSLAEWILDGSPRTADIRPFGLERFVAGRTLVGEHPYEVLWR